MEKEGKISWEEAVIWFCSQTSNRQEVLNNYFDEDTFEAAERFYNSAEFTETMKWLPPHPGKLLEIGAGRGIASYAFAKKGYEVTALEPDPSNFVGAGAIKKLIARTRLEISVKEDFGERLPFSDKTFDIVYVRQVLHHAKDLNKFSSEVYRVLNNKGVFAAVREHVIDDAEGLKVFLNNHPLHHLYGGENAYTLYQYLSALKVGGFKKINKLAPFDSDINLFPSSKNKIKSAFNYNICRFNPIYNMIFKFYNFKFRTPGRLYSFFSYKF